jgi:hypothetical protein
MNQYHFGSRPVDQQLQELIQNFTADQGYEPATDQVRLTPPSE